ncbi:MAG: hypothetical protein ACJAV7_000281 [Flavobacteriales bacterium]|jgi:hypothetical protein
MRKIYSLAFAVIAVQFAFAQNAQQVKIPAEKNVAVSTNGYRMTGSEEFSQVPLDRSFDKKPVLGVLKSATYWEQVIGTTIYDLQSNSATDNRLAQTGDDLSAAWLMSQTTDFGDRGTGYNYKGGGFWGDHPESRIESVRIGWPSIMHTESGREVVISHPGTGGLLMAHRDAGSGSWTETDLETLVSPGLLWPRAVADGNTIHMIAITMPVANDGLEYAGLDGAILYYRSQDAGDTWDMVDVLISGMDTTDFNNFDGDTYAIHARDGKVAFAIFNDWDDTFVMTSGDAGDTWDKTNIISFPLEGYVQDESILDMNEDGLADTVSTSDGAGAIFIDESMMTHVSFGAMNHLDEIVGDGTASYFPFTDGLHYWNETMGEDSTKYIAFVEDLDGNDLFDAEDVGTYFTSLTSQPNFAQGEDGTLYCVYTAVMESHSSGSQNYRHVHVVTSDDSGATWSDPLNLTPDLDFWGFECVFPCIAPVVDDYLHITYMRDFEPGLHVRGDLDPADVNDIVYLQISTDLVVEEGVSVEDVNPLDAVVVYPVPADETIFVALPGLYNVNISIYDLTGKLVRSAMNANDLVQIDLRSIEAGIYLIEMKQGEFTSTQKLVIQ